MYFWLKAFHLIFMVCWFAGIFYLPRIFVYYASSEHEPTRAQLALMARRLFFFITPLAILTLCFGIGLVSLNPSAYGSATWFQIKLAGVLLLMLYHGSCYVYMRQLQRSTVERSSRFFRFYNEAPVLLLFALILLAVLKPW